MRDPIRFKKRAFTVIEIVVAISIMVLVVAATTSIFVHGLKAWHEQAIENKLHVNIEKAIEWIRYDLRLSSMSIGASMAFYPTNSEEYVAISMPIAADNDGDGLFERDSLGKLIWDTTVIYHVREGTPWELVRTTFSPKNTNATPAEIYQQLEMIVNGGTTNAALPGEEYSSRIIFHNLVDLKFCPIPTLFDGYAPSVTLQKYFNFGSIMLGPGNHTLKLKLEG
ncbi:MAG: type II secretion system protein, partial [Lentisphaerae bacterium]|nr:type II secretion system protein [Lentisphaerota bacterium]